MKNQTDFRAGAVPEHFFYPWQKWLNSSKSAALRWKWEEFPGGSGAMIKALEEDVIDGAFLLTESALMAKSRGANFEIFSVFVESPLIWGIFTSTLSKVRSVPEGQTYAVSRMQSGSHLMAMLEAASRNKNIDANAWKLVGDLSGARQALKIGEADLFFWEKWTTSPLVKSGEFRMLAEFPGPWPAFVFCVREDILKDDSMDRKLRVDFTAVCKLAQELKANIQQTVKEISEFYQLPSDETAEWLQHVKWSEGIKKAPEVLSGAKRALVSAGIISQEIP